VRRIRTVVVCCSIFIALNGAVFSQQPSEFESLLASAQQAQAKGDFEAATDFYKKAVSFQPKVAELRANLGLMYYQTGQAAEAYKTALATGAFPSGTHAAYGFVLLSQHDFPGAEREFNAELASNLGSLMAKLGLARMKVEQGDPRKSADEIAEIWNANASFLRARASMFNRGLPTSKSSELQRTLEEGTAAGEIPKEVVSLFQNKRTSGVTDLPQPSSNAVDMSRRSSRQSASTPAKYKECDDLLPVRSQQLERKTSDCWRHAPTRPRSTKQVSMLLRNSLLARPRKRKACTGKQDRDKS